MLRFVSRSSSACGALNFCRGYVQEQKFALQSVGISGSFGLNQFSNPSIVSVYLKIIGKTAIKPPVRIIKKEKNHFGQLIINLLVSM